MSALLLLGVPSLAYGEKGYANKSFDEVKTEKLQRLQRMESCIIRTSNFEEMKLCKPKRRPMGRKPEAWPSEPTFKNVDAQVLRWRANAAPWRLVSSGWLAATEKVKDLLSTWDRALVKLRKTTFGTRNRIESPVPYIKKARPEPTRDSYLTCLICAGSTLRASVLKFTRRHRM